MTLNPELKKINAAANSLLAPQDQIMSDLNLNVTMDAADVAAVIPIGYPIGYNESTGNHGRWIAPDATVVVITLTGATGGTFTVTVNSATTAAIAYNASAATITAALKAIGYAVSVVKATLVYTLTFDGAAEVKVLPAVSADTSLATGDVTESVTVNDGTAQVPDPTILNISTGATVPATGGTFTITYDGNTSAAIAFDATGPEIEAAILIIATHAPDSVTVTRDGLGDITVYFDDLADLLSLPTVSATLTSLTGATAELATAIAGNVIVPDETDVVIEVGTATGGTFTVTVDGTTTAPIAYNATVGVVDAALLAIGYSVTTGLVSTAYTITFDVLAQQITLPVVTGSIAALTGAALTVAVATGTATNGLDKIRGFVNPNTIQVGTKSGTAALVVLTGTDTVCTATAVNHGLATGMSVTHAGASEAKLNITATITVVDGDTYTYTVAAVSGGTVDSGTYTTTNDQMGIIMGKGKIHYDLPSSLVAASDVTALATAMKAALIADGLIVQGLAGRY